MERAILAEMRQDGESDRVTHLAWQVARRLGQGIWTLDEHMARLKERRDRGELTPEQYTVIAAFVPRFHADHPEKLEKSFCASFSRALKRLEEKGLIDRYQETDIRREGDSLVYYLIKLESNRPRCTRTIRVRRKVTATEG